MPGAVTFSRLLLVAVTCGFACRRSGEDGRPGAVSLRLVSGAHQAGVVGRMLPNPIVVSLATTEGDAIAGGAVSFEVTSGGGTVLPIAAITGSDGTARAAWTLGRNANSRQTVRATATVPSFDGVISPVDVDAAATPDAAWFVTVVSGNGQTGTQHYALAEPAVASVRDQYGNRAGGSYAITFAPDEASLAVEATVTTDASGEARYRWTPHGAGEQRIRASAPGLLAARFSATVAAGGQTFDGEYALGRVVISGSAEDRSAVESSMEVRDGAAGLYNDLLGSVLYYPGYSVDETSGAASFLERYSLDRRRRYIGTFSVDPKGAATASGTYDYTVFDALDPDSGSGTWSAVRR